MMNRVARIEKQINQRWDIWKGDLPEDTMGLIGWQYGTIKIPNFNDLIQYYTHIHRPYTKETLPNLREVDSCYNCEFVIAEFCGSHTEYDCGLTTDYIAGNKICDLHKRNR